MADKFHIKNGRLSVYALACGYYEKHDFASIGQRITLSMDGGHFHVKGFVPWKGTDKDFPIGDPIAISQGRRVWDVYTTIASARKKFDKLVCIPDTLSIVP
jgi:hypothetical protein